MKTIRFVTLTVLLVSAGAFLVAMAQEHPANRFEFSHGRDLIVDPGPESGPINFLAYPLLEIDGQPQIVKSLFLFQRRSYDKES